MQGVALKQKLEQNNQLRLRYRRASSLAILKAEMFITFFPLASTPQVVPWIMTSIFSLSPLGSF
jgi:hypothetical protein